MTLLDCVVESLTSMPERHAWKRPFEETLRRFQETPPAVVWSRLFPIWAVLPRPTNASVVSLVLSQFTLLLDFGGQHSLMEMFISEMNAVLPAAGNFAVSRKLVEQALHDRGLFFNGLELFMQLDKNSTRIRYVARRAVCSNCVCQCVWSSCASWSSCVSSSCSPLAYFNCTH